MSVRFESHRTFCILILGLVVSACSSMNTKPYTETKKNFLIDTKLSKTKAFESSAVWLAKRASYGLARVRLNDSINSRLVAEIVFSCKGLKRPDLVLDAATTEVDFLVDIAIKDNKVKYELEMSGFEGSVGEYGRKTYYVAQAEGQDEAVNNCFSELKTKIVKATLENGPDANW
jgi:hypothetical protein